MNKMQVMEAYFEDGFFQGNSNPLMQNYGSFELIAESIVYNSTAFIESGSKDEVSGNVTEVGLIKYLTQSKVNVEKMME